MYYGFELKAKAKYSYALWAVVFFRLVCPFSIQLPVSAVPVQPQTIPQDIVYSENPSIQSGLPVVDNAVNTAIERSFPSGNPADSAGPLHAVLEVSAYLWLALILALLLYGSISYVLLKRRLRTAIRVRSNIYETDRIKTAFVLGFMHPKIYIPTGLGESELKYVIDHERTHIRRLDYLIKPLAFLITAPHWFNPLAWASYALMARDMELSADESVVKLSRDDIRAGYSVSLLALSMKRSGLLSPLAFGETGVKERVKNVLRYKKPALWVGIVTVAVVIAASLLLLGCGDISGVEEDVDGIIETSPAVTTPESPLPTSSVAPETLSPEQPGGETRIFDYNDRLSLEITNVASVETRTGIDDGGNPREYTAYILYPGARLTVINADMDDGAYAENGQPHANWGIYLKSDDRIYITDDMPPYEITSEVQGGYNTEASMFVLVFEMYGEA